MITAGIDLSSQRKGTASYVIEWHDGWAVARPPRAGCSDLDLDDVIKQADVVGIDAPFGWPVAFADAVTKWRHDSWSNDLRDRMCFRTTDVIARERYGRWPLSVSTDRIALPAMRAMSLLRRHGVTDRSGDGRFFEVYPAASMREWGLNVRGYKGVKTDSLPTRKGILGELRELIPWLDVGDKYAATDHNIDALVASLTARAATQGRTLKPTSEQLPAARTEGGIHVPIGLPIGRE